MGNCFSDAPDDAKQKATPFPPAAGAAATDEAQQLALATRGEDFSFANQRFLAKVVEYYDGDTVRVVFNFGGRRIQYRARMVGYDSPEMKPLKSNPNREAEKAAANAARSALIAKVAEGSKEDLVFIECGEFDKYGRVLVTMFTRAGAKNGENVNAWMVANDFGTPYDGGTKKAFDG